MANKQFFQLAFLLPVVISLAACNAPAIQSVSTTPPIVLNQATTFLVSGRGTCGAIRVRFGDGNSQVVSNPNLGAGVRIQHTYRGWPGPKNVIVETVDQCLGRVIEEITVLTPNRNDTSLTVGLCVGNACQGPVTPAPPLSSDGCTSIGRTVRRASSVSIRSTRPDNFINMGGTVGDRTIDGSPDIALGPPFTFPFPGFKAHSLILRIGSQVAQGGEGASFVANQGGPLEICVNDDVRTDNSGAWGLAISVDERAAVNPDGNP